MNLVLDGSADLTAGELVVLLVLAQHADEQGGSCYPSQSTIRRKGRFKDIRSVKKILARLRERTFLELVEAATPRRSARYRLNLPALASGEPSSPLRGPRFTSDVNQVPLRGVRSSPDPSRDPSLTRPDQDQRRSRGARLTYRTDHNPNALVRLAHAVYDDVDAGTVSPSDLTEEFKCRCARLGLDYSGYRQALDSAEAQRRRA